MDDKQTSLQQHLSLIGDVCEAVIQHVQSLQVSYLVVKRIFGMSHALLACHLSSSSADQDFVSHYRQVFLNVFFLCIFFIFRYMS